MREAIESDEPLPEGIADKIHATIAGNTQSWDATLWEIAVSTN
jgi:hypothetical protein